MDSGLRSTSFCFDHLRSPLFGQAVVTGAPCYGPSFLQHKGFRIPAHHRCASSSIFSMNIRAYRRGRTRMLYAVELNRFAHRSCWQDTATIGGSLLGIFFQLQCSSGSLLRVSPLFLLLSYACVLYDIVEYDAVK